MAIIWAAPPDVVVRLNDIKQHNHPRLESARIALAFSDMKIFKNNRLNFGKVVRFNSMNKLFQNTKYDFCVIISFDLWSDFLNVQQRDALLDLHLCRLSPKYVPQTQEINGKKSKVVDEHGKILYTTDIKVDDNGDTEFEIFPLDMMVMADNIRRYGLWTDEMTAVKEAIDSQGV